MLIFFVFKFSVFLKRALLVLARLEACGFIYGLLWGA